MAFLSLSLPHTSPDLRPGRGMAERGHSMSGCVEKSFDLTDEQAALVYLFASKLAESGSVIQAAAASVALRRRRTRHDVGGLFESKALLKCQT